MSDEVRASCSISCDGTSVKFSVRFGRSRGAVRLDPGMEHQCDLAERFGKLLFDPEFSDLVLIVGGEAHPVHRAILVRSSEYFRALIQGGVTDRELVLEDVPLTGFKLLMKYIYTGRMTFRDLDTRTLFEVFQVAQLFGLQRLLASLSWYVEEAVPTEELCEIYSKTPNLQIPELDEAICRSIEEHPDLVLKSEVFRRLPTAIVCKILSRDSFCADEIEIFKAVQLWCLQRPNGEDNREVLGTVRLPLIATRDILSTVKDSGLVETDRLFEALALKESRPAELNYRFQLITDTNLAAPDRGTQELTPCADGDIKITGRSYKSRPLCLEFHRDHPTLIIALNKPYSVNLIEFELHEELLKLDVSGFVEVSVDLESWIHLGGYGDGKYFAKFHFEPRVIRYIRLHQTKFNVALSKFEVCHSR